MSAFEETQRVEHVKFGETFDNGNPELSLI